MPLLNFIIFRLEGDRDCENSRLKTRHQDRDLFAVSIALLLSINLYFLVGTTVTNLGARSEQIGESLEE